MAPITQDSVSTDDADLQAKVRAAKEEMTRSIALAGLMHDPLKHPLMAMATMLEVLGAAAGSVQTAVRKPISTEVEAEMIRRLAQSASSGASQHTADLVKAHNLRTVLIAAGIFVTSIVAASTGGYWWSARQPVDTNLGQMSRNAVAVLQLNNLDAALNECTPIPQTSGRRACAVRLWLETARP